MFHPVALQRSDIVAITELGEEVLEDPPVALARGTAKAAPLPPRSARRGPGSEGEGSLRRDGRRQIDALEREHAELGRSAAGRRETADLAAGR
jgi:hypothetical protein